MQIDSIDDKNASPISVFRVSQNDKANQELEKMRIE